MNAPDNNINVGDVFSLKAKILGYDDYCPVNGHRYKMQLMSNSGVNISQAILYICSPDILLDKEKPATDSTFPLLWAGDIAKCVEIRGRKPTCRIGDVNVRLLNGDIVTVITNEIDTKNDTVDIKFQCGTEATIDPVYLELLTPVKELKPYYVVCSPAERAFKVCRTAAGNSVTRMCYFYKEGTHEGEERTYCAEMTEAEAEKAAEDECNRLNEQCREYRNK